MPYILDTTPKKKYFLNDRIAKKIFKDDVLGKKLCARIISDLLELDYHEVYHSLHKTSEDIAFQALSVDSRSDVILHHDSMIIDIEINYKYYRSKPIVLETYVWQLLLNQVKSYKDYNKLKEVVQISIDAYDFFNNNMFIYKSYLMEETTHQKTSNSLIMYHLNLAYLQEIDYTLIKKNKLMYDLFFLICGSKLFNEIYKGDKFMEEIISNARQIAGEENIPLFASEEEIMKLDEEFIRNQSKKEMVLNFYHNGVSLDIIAKSANLTIDEVKAIIEKE